VGSGQDWAYLDDRGCTVTVQSVSVLVGGAANDWVNLGDTGNSVSVSVVETLVGGAGADWVNLSSPSNSLILAAVETLVGGAGQDWINLGNRGNTMILAAVETLVGGAGQDWINLGNRGNTMVLAAVETLVGGASGDEISLGNRGNTMVLTAVETLLGGTGQDFVLLGNRGNTMLVSGVDILVGGVNSDDITVSSGRVQFDGRGGADRLELQDGANNDLILYNAADEGAAAGQATGFDVIANFQSGTDTVGLIGALRGQLDDNGDGVLTGAEVRSVGGAIGPLNDDGFASLRAALGTVTAGDTVLALASDGYNSGLYVVQDTGDGVIAANEVRMLARFDGAVLGIGDLRFL